MRFIGSFLEFHLFWQRSRFSISLFLSYCLPLLCDFVVVTSVALTYWHVCIKLWKVSYYYPFTYSVFVSLKIYLYFVRFGSTCIINITKLHISGSFGYSFYSLIKFWFHNFGSRITVLMRNSGYSDSEIA